LSLILIKIILEVSIFYFEWHNYKKLVIITYLILACYHIGNYFHLDLLLWSNISGEILLHRLDLHIHQLINIYFMADIIKALLFFNYRIILVIYFQSILISLYLYCFLLLLLLKTLNKFLLLECIFRLFCHPVIYIHLIFFIILIIPKILLLII
jgi:hypothetical protein